MTSQQVKGNLKRPLGYDLGDPSTHRRPTESSDLVSTVRRRRLAATALATTALLALGGCGTGFSAQTNQVYQAGVGADYRGEIDVLNTLLVANDDGTATLSTSMVNNSDAEQTLAGVTATTLKGQELPVVSTETKLPLRRGVLSTVGGAADAGGFWVSKGATAGDYVRLTLTFDKAAPVTLEAPVVGRSEEYAKVASAPPTTPEPSPTPSDTASAE